MIIDRERSMMKIHETWFPACGVLCPEHPDTPQRPCDRWLGERLGWFVPLENGVLACVETGKETLQVILYSWLCVEDRIFPDEDRPVYTPGYAYVANKHVYHGGALRKTGYWHGCEEEWVAEHLQRIAHYPTISAHLAGAPKVKLLSIAQTEQLAEELTTWREASKG